MIRKGMPSPDLSKKEFLSRFLQKFFDPEFENIKMELQKAGEIAWNAYDESRKSPRTKKAGKGFAETHQELDIEWLATRQKLLAAQKVHANPKLSPRILLINASPRSEWTCPGEMSKSYRLIEIAQRTLKQKKFETDVLDLSLVTSEYGKHIHPCKSCVSTAMPLCHWPCSCYPNYALQQDQDWMAEIYERWVLAHGVMIITPVHWYQTPSVLKLMMDRLVCADGGNPDPTTTDGKDAKKAKLLELKGWDYPKHLAGRIFSIIVHGDAGGSENVRHALSDWLNDIGLQSAAPRACLDRYIGYMSTYAESHQELDKDKNLQDEVRIAAHALGDAIILRRIGKNLLPKPSQESPRPK